LIQNQSDILNFIINNEFNIEFEQGAISSVTGKLIDSPTSARSKNYLYIPFNIIIKCKTNKLNIALWLIKYHKNDSDEYIFDHCYNMHKSTINSIAEHTLNQNYYYKFCIYTNDEIIDINNISNYFEFLYTVDEINSDPQYFNDIYPTLNTIIYYTKNNNDIVLTCNRTSGGIFFYDIDNNKSIAFSNSTINFPYTLNNFDYLAFNISTKTLEAIPLNEITGNHIILLYNHYGYPKGPIYPYLVNTADTSTETQITEITSTNVDIFAAAGTSFSINKLNNNVLEVQYNGVNGINAIVIYFNKNVKVIQTRTLSFPYTLNNFEYLVYDIDSSTIKIISTESELKNITYNYCILLFNHYGYPKGPMEKYYYRDHALDNLDINLNTNNIPDYYFENDYLPNKIEQIIKNTELINEFSFCFVTDLHFQSNAFISPYIIKYIIQHTSVNYCLCGGDYPAAYGTKDYLYEQARKLLEYAGVIGHDKFFAVRGNHDFCIKTDSSYTTGATGTGYTAPVNEIYNYITKFSEPYVDNIQAGKMYYYIDNKPQKTRIFMLDSHEGHEDDLDTTKSWNIAYTPSKDQIDWLIENLQNTPSDYRIIAVCHCSPSSRINNISSAAIPFLKILSAIKHRTTLNLTYAGNNFTSDFSQSTLEVVCFMNGHWHRDMVDVVEDILCVTTTSDAYYRDDLPFERSKGTINEQAIDVVTCDYDNKKLLITRVGTAKDRLLYYDANNKYNVIYNLTDCYSHHRSYSDRITLFEGSSYWDQIRRDDKSGNAFDSISVTMSGIDITNDVVESNYYGYYFYIEHITGEIQVTAVATAN